MGRLRAGQKRAGQGYELEGLGERGSLRGKGFSAGSARPGERHAGAEARRWLAPGPHRGESLKRVGARPRPEQMGGTPGYSTGYPASSATKA
jgi:hypothetical protein